MLSTPSPSRQQHTTTSPLRIIPHSYHHQNNRAESSSYFYNYVKSRSLRLALPFLWLIIAAMAVWSVVLSSQLAEDQDVLYLRHDHRRGQSPSAGGEQEEEGVPAKALVLIIPSPRLSSSSNNNNRRRPPPPRVVYLSLQQEEEEEMDISSSSSHHQYNTTTTTPPRTTLDELRQNNPDSLTTGSTRRSSSHAVPTYPRVAAMQRHQREHDQTRLYSQLDSSRDLPGMERRVWPHHELQDHPTHPQHCVPMYRWQSHFNPVCNLVHERFGWSDELVDNSLNLLSDKGFWRHAWKHNDTSFIARSNSGSMDTRTTITMTTTPTVWRTFKMEHDMEEAFFENARVDAVAMERLTASPYIIDIFGFCGMTVVTEFAGKELSEVVASQKLNSTERLQLAVQVARGVADIHSIGGDDGNNDDSSNDSSLHDHNHDHRKRRHRSRPPSLVHNDLNLANLRVTQDHRPVWNDFNIAVLLMVLNETGEPCPFASRFPNPQWRAPEEQVFSQEETDTTPPIVTEKIDIYALGNVLYRLAVGASPWKKVGAIKLTAEEKLEVAQLKRINGTQPQVPDDILASDDPAVQVMLQAMQQTYRFHPQDRPTASAVANLLQQGLERIISRRRSG